MDKSVYKEPVWLTTSYLKTELLFNLRKLQNFLYVCVSFLCLWCRYLKQLLHKPHSRNQLWQNQSNRLNQHHHNLRLRWPHPLRVVRQRQLLVRSRVRSHSSLPTSRPRPSTWEPPTGQLSYQCLDIKRYWKSLNIHVHVCAHHIHVHVHVQCRIVMFCVNFRKSVVRGKHWSIVRSVFFALLEISSLASVTFFWLLILCM